MKTKVLLSLMAFVLVLAVNSCSQNEDLGAVVGEPRFAANDYRLSQDEAIAVAADAVSSLTDVKTRAGGALTVKDVSRFPVPTRAGGQDEPGFYIVNFEGGGYAVVPNDKRAAGVYAYSDKGAFDADGNDGTRLFMKMAEECLENEIYLPDSIGEVIPPGYGFVEADTAYEVFWYNGEYCYCVVEESNDTVLNLLDTQWGQEEAPYNSECFKDNGEQAVVGCVALALGQIMAYHKEPQSYNGHIYYWDDMPWSKYWKGTWMGTDEEYSVAYLLHDIGVALNTKYGTAADGGSTAKASDCPNALNKFGYTSDGVKDYSFSEVMKSLDKNRPVYVNGVDEESGKGHAWVASGYRCMTRKVKYYTVKDDRVVYSQTSYLPYIYVNAGYFGKYDGYYYNGIFSSREKSYSVRVKMITNIRYNK